MTPELFLEMAEEGVFDPEDVESLVSGELTTVANDGVILVLEPRGDINPRGGDQNWTVYYRNPSGSVPDALFLAGEMWKYSHNEVWYVLPSLSHMLDIDWGGTTISAQSAIDAARKMWNLIKRAKSDATPQGR